MASTNTEFKALGERLLCCLFEQLSVKWANNQATDSLVNKRYGVRSTKVVHCKSV